MTILKKNNGVFMNEYELLSLMYMGFAFNAMYFVGFVLLTWLGFRMARTIYDDSSATLSAKVFTSIFVMFVAFFFFQSNQVGGGILSTYAAQLVEIGSSSGERLTAFANSPTVLDGPLQSIFSIFILVFQLGIIWIKKLNN